VIEARQLTKRFGGRAAVEEVSLRVGRGEVVGFLGPNGAGKTTTLRCLAGVFPPSAGQALLGDVDVVRAPLAARRLCGYAPERPALWPDMTVGGLCRYLAALRDAPSPRAAAATALERTGLAAVAAERIGILSRGFRQRVGLAAALAGDPPALLLDEPTAGLDPEQSAEMRRMIRALGQDHAVLVSSHALAEMETLTDRVIVLHQGRVLADEPPARLAARLRPASRVDVEVVAGASALVALLAAVPGVERVHLLGTDDGRARCRVEAAPGHDVRVELAARITARGWGLLELTAVETSLEEAFLALVGGTERAA
jgi:ABC-2 type transport system ATP-binding protein